MNKPNSLQELAQLAIDQQGVSARQVAIRAEKEGLKLTYTTLNQMRAGTYKYEPRPDTLRALARLAGISDQDAFTAAGKEAPGPPLADELPPGSDGLSPRSRKVVVDLLRVLIDLEDTGNADSETNKRTAPSPVTPLRAVEDEPAQQDPQPEQKMPFKGAAYRRGLGDGIGPDDLPSD